MRINLPVSGNELRLPDNASLVSTTDLKGRIQYCNRAFIEVSGYSREELLGQPHNLIRHPDMPAEAFRDLWATIRSGRPWSACVKNRRKNGDHYWVLANVTPLMDASGPVGYMSVRTCPSVEQVRTAEALYARMREERAAGGVHLTLCEGHAQPPRAWGGLPARIGRSLPVGLGVVVLAASLGSFVAGLTLGRDASAPLLGLGVAASATLANRMAAGDLTQRIDTSGIDPVGRLARALNQLNLNLRAMVGDARSEVERIRRAVVDSQLSRARCVPSRNERRSRRRRSSS